MTSPDLRGAVARLTGVPNFEFLDLSFPGGRCCVTSHAAAVKRFVRARSGVLDVAPSVTKAGKVVVLVDFDKLTRDALTPTENNKCSTSEEVFGVGGTDEAPSLVDAFQSDRDAASPQICQTRVEDMIFSSKTRLTPPAEAQGTVESTTNVSEPAFFPVLDHFPVTRRTRRRPVATIKWWTRIWQFHNYNNY